MEKIFGDLSEFKGRDVELFRSSDLRNTAIYFTNVESKDKETASAFFEILRFGLNGGDHQLYVRFPDTEHFVEMIYGGMGSGRGNMTESNGRNVWESGSGMWKHNYNTPFKIYSHDNNLILLIGDAIPEFNFMTKVASYDKGNKFNHPYPNETFLNFSEIEKALQMKYLKIPESVRKIQYCYKTKDVIAKYYLIDSPAYNSKYSNHRFFVIENDTVNQFEIKDFQRFRDGGTTIITVIDNDEIKHEFFSPQTMFTTGKDISTTFDNIELIKVTKEEEDNLVKLLNLELEPVLID